MRPALRALASGQAVNHSDINALRRWALDAYNIRHLEIAPNASEPDTQIDITIDLAAMRSVGGEVAIKTAATTPAISLTLDVELSGIGGLDTGKLGASGLYAIYVAAQAESENGIATDVGVIASSDWQSPALPAGWTHKRFVGAFATQEDETTGEAVIKPFTQLDDWFFYHEAQKAVEWSSITESQGRTELSIGNIMPLVCEEVFIDAQIIGGSAPFTLKLYEHHTGQEIIDLNPGTEDFGHESVWMFAPRQFVDYSVDVTTAVSGSIRVLGFRVPISQEF